MLDQDIRPGTHRFSNRAESYRQFRPAYLQDIVRLVRTTIGLQPTHHIADIGMGTGRFAELFLREGYTVTGIEPNPYMRMSAEQKLAPFSKFTSLDGSGEKTGLADSSVDLITVAHAFHWMNTESIKEEFRRILKPKGYILLAWMMRQTDTPFLKAYDQLKKEFRDSDVPTLIDEERIQSFFEPGLVGQHVFPQNVWMDFDGLKGLLLSSSGIPLPGQHSYDTMISSLVQLFVAHNQNGFINMEYSTKLYWCQL